MRRGARRRVTARRNTPDRAAVTAESPIDLVSLTATEGAARVRAGELEPSAWMEACLARIAAIEDEARAWTFLDHALAGDAARDRDGVEWANVRPEPLLAGVPVAVKDCFNTSAMPTAMGSDLWRGFTPGNDARVISRAKLLGAVMVGKTVTAEFATHAPGSTRNPRDRDRIPGTSSTGSAVAVACGMVPVALATQTAGSIIRPASYCGVIGFKPSFGLIPRTGVLKTVDTLDTIGFLARSIADVRLMLEALRVRGRDYPMTERGLARAAAKREGSRGWKVALGLPPTWDGAKAYARDGVVEFANQLANRADVSVEELDLRQLFADAHQTMRTIYHKQLSYYFEKELQQPDKVSDIFRQVTDEGARITPDEYLAATARQRAIEGQLHEVMDGFDALITLSVAGEAPTWSDGVEADDSALIWTLAGAPSLSLPLFTGPHGLPFGLQLVAPRYGDYTLLDLAATVCPESVPIVVPVAG